MPTEITREQLIDAFFLESGNEDLLLEKISAGIKAATVQLVILYMPIIMQLAHLKYKNQKRRPMQYWIQMAIVILVNYIEQQAEFIKENKLDTLWKEKIQRVISEGLENEIVNLGKNSKFDITRDFLNRI
jgi:hypothetical protein